MAAVDEIARIITSALVIDKVYDEFANHLRRLVEFDFLCILILDRDAGTIYYEYGFYGQGRTVPGIEVGGVFPLAGTRAQLVLETGHTMIQEDITKGPEYWPDHEYSKAGLKSCIVVPVVSQGRVLRTINIFSRKLMAFGSRERVLLERLAAHIAPAMTNARLYEQVVSELEQRELAEEALRESEMRFRQISENMDEAVFLNQR